MECMGINMLRTPIPNEVKSAINFFALGTKITKITKYPSFGEMLRKEGVDIVLPGVEGIRLGVNAYRNYYTVQEENRYGVLAIELVIV